jgi:hypothetical protein
VQRPVLQELHPFGGLLRGTFRERSGNIQSTFSEHSGNIQSTFREHSGNTRNVQSRPPGTAPLRRPPEGNIQGTFREHSEHIQGTFRERSGRIERTPVSLHPKCKKHLKKEPRLTQNTTCKHEYLRGLTKPNDVSQEKNSVFSRTVPPGTFRAHSGKIKGTFRETFREHKER